MWTFITVVVSFLVVIEYSASVRVCKTFLDYDNPHSTNCFNNSVTESNATEILRSWGCTVKEYNLMTDDGYEILVIRAYKIIRKNTPIIMTHGMTGNCLCFLTMYNKTLSYNFLQNGYQVFFINFRGSVYSKGHVQYTQNDTEYWNYSFHEMAAYDVPRCLKLVRAITGQKSIIIGISLGSQVTIAYASLFPAKALDNLKGIISISHAVTFRYSTSLVVSLAKYWKFIRPLAESSWHGRFLPRSEEFLNTSTSGAGSIILSLSVLGPVFGANIDHVDPLYAPVTLKLLPDTTSLRVIDHNIQIMDSGQFQQFDYGTSENFVKYGTSKPPLYDVSKIKIPVAIFLGENDRVGSIRDGREMYMELAPEAQCGLQVIPYRKWNHVDVVFAKNVNTTLNPLVYAKVKQMESGSCSRYGY